MRILGWPSRKVANSSGRRPSGRAEYQGSPGHLGFLVGAGGILRKIAVGHVLDLVVVVEDHAAVAGDPKFFHSMSPGKMLAMASWLMAWPACARLLDLRVGGLGEVDVEGRHAPLDVQVLDDQGVAVLPITDGASSRSWAIRSGWKRLRGSATLENSRVSAIRPTRSTWRTSRYLRLTVARSMFFGCRSVLDDLEHVGGRAA